MVVEKRWMKKKRFIIENGPLSIYAKNVMTNFPKIVEFHYINSYDT